MSNNFGLFVKYVYNLPQCFGTWNIDEKGQVGSNHNDHLFRYEVSVGLPVEPVAEVPTENPMVQSELELKLPSMIGNGKYRPLTTEEWQQLHSMQHTFSGDEQAPLDERPEGEPLISWIWHPVIDREREELEEAKAAEKSGAKGKEKPGKKKPKDEEEERRRKEEEEREKERTERPPLAPNAILHVPLSSDTLAQLDNMAHAGQPLTLTFKRVLRNGLPTDWKADANELRYTAQAFVDLTPFLEPGTARHTYSIPLMPLPPPDVPEDVKAQASAKKVPPKKAVRKRTDIPLALAVEEDRTDVHPYAEAHTTLVLEISFSTPLVHLPERRPRPDLRPYDIIPRRVRPTRPQRDTTALFADEIRSIVTTLATEWQTCSPKASHFDSTQAQSFLQSLDGSGLRESMRERLRQAVQRVVKDKFVQQSATGAKDTAFYNEVYVYLQEAIHTALRKVFTVEERLPVEEENQPNKKWKRLADEAELLDDTATASRYHHERLVYFQQDGTDLSEVGERYQDVWHDYAEFCLRVRDYAKAEHAFREAIALDMAHIDSLIGYGLLLLHRQHFTEAEVFLQSAVDGDVSSARAWACLGLFLELAAAEDGDTYRRRERTRESLYSYNQAKRILQSEGRQEEMFSLLGEFLLDLRFEGLAEHCLAKLQVTPPMLAARMHTQRRNFTRAEQIMRAHLTQRPDDVPARLLLAEVLREQGRAVEAEKCYDAAIGLDAAQVGGLTYLRLGDLLMGLNRAEDARDAYIVGAQKWPCSRAWLGVGISYYRMGDFPHAEQALNEANVLNNLQPATWAYLCLVCLKTSRPSEADQAWDQALRLRLQDADLLAEIGREQHSAGRPQLAEAAFRRSLQERDLPSTKILLANTLVALHQLPDARKEYEAVIANKQTDPSMRQQAQAQVRILDSLGGTPRVPR